MRDITLCHPRLQRIASAWIKACATEGITVAISETLRTAAEQDALYAQGSTNRVASLPMPRAAATAHSISGALLLTSTSRWTLMEKKGRQMSNEVLSALIYG